MEEKEASNGKEGHEEHEEVDQLVEVLEEAEVINAEGAEPELDAVVDDLIEENGVGEKEEEEENIPASDEKEEGLSETVLTQAESLVTDVVTINEFEENGQLGLPSLEANRATSDLVPSDEAVAVAEDVTSSSRDVEAFPDAEETKGVVHLEDNSATLVKESASVAVVKSSDAVPDQSTVVPSTPIISLSQRTVQPTSWRSCCGLFDVLRRSNG